MAQTLGGHTRNHSLYLDLRRSLVAGDFPAGHRFRLNDLCKQFGVSVSVVREALTRLSEQGLVDAEPNKGFSAPAFTVEEIDDITFLREEVEVVAVKLAMQRGGVAWESNVVGAFHTLAVTPNVPLEHDPEANELWTQAHRAFHLACVEGCGSVRLLSLREQLQHQSEFIRQVARLDRDAGRDVVGEHRALREALVGRNAELAERLLRGHIEATRLAFAHVWKAAPMQAQSRQAPSRADRPKG